MSWLTRVVKKPITFAEEEFESSSELIEEEDDVEVLDEEEEEEEDEEPTTSDIEFIADESEGEEEDVEEEIHEGEEEEEEAVFTPKKSDLEHKLPKLREWMAQKKKNESEKELVEKSDDSVSHILGSHMSLQGIIVMQSQDC